MIKFTKKDFMVRDLMRDYLLVVNARLVGAQLRVNGEKVTRIYILEYNNIYMYCCLRFTMNIFILDEDPIVAATMYCDSHVCKLIIELGQQLSTAHHIHNSEFADVVYRKTHTNHPCTIWVRTTSSNYDWAYVHFVALCDEYTKRYGKTHLTDKKLRDVLSNNPVPIGELTPFALAIPEQYKCDCTIKSYRDYYLNDKRNIALWKHGPTPHWWN